MRRFLLLLLIPFLGIGQQYNPSTPSYVVPNGPLITTGVRIIPSAYNIGQQLHQLAVIARDITAASCSGAGGWAGSIRLEGSFDNTTWGQMGPAVTQATTINIPSLSSIQGQFPFLRLNYIAGNNGQCAVDIWYTGTLSGTPQVLPDLRYTSFNNSVNTEQVLVSCVKARAVVYSLSLVNGSVANGFVFNVKTGASPGAGSIVDAFNIPVTFAANQEYILPLGGGGPYFKAPQNDVDSTFFTVTATNATNFSVRATYRCE